MRQERYDQTLALLDEVLSIRESAFGPDSLPVARTRFNLGVVASYSGDFERAFALIDSGLAVFREQYGERSIEAAIGFFHRGASHEALGRFDAALRDYESSLAILDTLASPTEGTRLNALQSLTGLRCRQGVAVDRARGDVEELLAALDRGNSDHQPWIERFEKLRESCALLGSVSRPSAAAIVPTCARRWLPARADGRRAACCPSSSCLRGRRTRTTCRGWPARCTRRCKAPRSRRSRR